MSPPTISRCLLVCVLLGLGCCAVPAPAADDDDARLEQFLERLGLDDLRITHLEEVRQRQTDAESKLTLARQLADLYAQRLIALAGEPQRYEALLTRVKSLLAEIPRANTASMQVILLQADYKRAETLITPWLNDPGQESARQQAHQVLSRVAVALADRQNELVKKLDAFTAELDELSEEDEERIAQLNREIKRLDAVAARAMYYNGWANYYFAIAKGGASVSRSELETARASFRRFLSIDKSEKYQQIDADSLELGFDLKALSLIGLAMTELAAGGAGDARRLFEMLDESNASPTLRDQRARWYLRGLLNAGDVGEALRYAAAEIGKYDGAATQGKVDFCHLLVMAGYGDTRAQVPADKRRLGELGVRGMARLRQFRLLSQSMARYKIAPQGDDFYLTWLRGRQRYNEARKNNSTAAYLDAAKLLTAALALPGARQDVAAAGDCRNTLAWCYYLAGQFDKAAEQFRQAADALATSGSKDAVQAIWMLSVVYGKLAKKESRYAVQAAEALESIKRDYPNHPLARRADLELARLRKSGVSTEESIRRLSNVPPNSENYLAALYEICTLRSRQWREAGGDSAKAATAANLLFASVDKYLVAARRDGGQQQKLKALLMASEAALRTGAGGVAKAKAYLSQAQPLTESLAAGNSSLRQYHARRMQLARLTGDAQSRLQHAAWLAEHAAGTVDEVSALIALAQHADDQVRQADDGNRDERLTKARQYYARLAPLLGDSGQQIKAQRNALVANSKLAHYEFETGRFAKAAARLETIVGVYPDNTGYLRRAGLAQFRAGKWAAALPHFNKLVSGLKSNTDEWFEAKYHQLAALAKADIGQARDLYRQFKRLYPQVKSPAWRDKFAELDRQLARP